MPLNTDCLLSTVKNTSGSAMTFAFLPPHGKQLAADEEVTIYGNVVEAVLRGDRGDSPRYSNALLSALDNGSLDIISTPSPMLYDATADATKQLALDNGALYAADPCWVGSAQAVL